MKRIFFWIAGVVLLLGLAGLFLLSGPRRPTMTPLLIEANHARQLAIFVIQTQLDHAADASNPVGWPAKTSVRTTRNYFQLLVDKGYVKQADIEKLHPEEFVLTNISAADSDDTALLVSRPFYEAQILHRECEGPQVVFLKNGAGGFPTAKGEADINALKLPPRTPAFLAP